MIVCICKAVNAKTIDQAIINGARSVCDIKKATGACSQCKKCAKEIHDMILVSCVIEDPNEETS